MKLPSSLKVSTCGPSRCRLERIYMQTSLLKRAVSSTTLSKIWLSVGPIFRGFAYNSLVSSPFLTRKVPNRSSQCPLSNGQGVASQIQLWVWLTPRSNLNQTWSNHPKLREMCSGLRFEGFRVQWTPVGSTRLGLGCLVLRVDIRENPEGKKKVMTIAPSLFGVSWHKECWKKNK